MKNRLGAVGVILVLMVGCSKPQPPVVAPSLPVVEVKTPSSRLVVDYQDFTGRAKASDSAELKARVTGELKKIHFKDGDIVKEGQLLFEIDPGTYGTDVDRAKAVVAQTEVTIKRYDRDFRRLEGVASATAEERDRATAALEEAKAAAEVARKQLAQAQRLLDYTKIKAPKNGRIGRHFVDEGSSVKADETILALIVVSNPMWVFFDVDDVTNQRLNKLRIDGKLNLTSTGTTAVQIGLPNEEGFSITGVVKFIDTQINPGTGTIQLRADVDNASGLLTAGMFVRVRLPIGEGKPSLLIPEEAIGTDQGLKYVFVLNAKDEVEYRQVLVGLQDGNERVVDAVEGKPGSGVKPGERVIVEGLQRVRKGSRAEIRGQRAEDSKTGKTKEGS
jgi:RND family efflux transporter MFP subunit